MPESGRRSRERATSAMSERDSGSPVDGTEGISEDGQEKTVVSPNELVCLLSMISKINIIKL